MQRAGGKGAGFIFSCMERKRCKVKGTAYMGNITNKLYYLIDLGENIFVDIAHRTSKLGQKQDGFKSRAKVVYIFLQLYCLSFILGSQKMAAGIIYLTASSGAEVGFTTV